MPSVLEEILIEEYERSRRMIGQLEDELASLPRGSIREKSVNGRTYYYLQYREGKHVRSLYIPKSRLDDVRDKLSRRKRCVDALEEQHKGMRQIERALGKKVLDEQTV